MCSRSVVQGRWVYGPEGLLERRVYTRKVRHTLKKILARLFRGGNVEKSSARYRSVPENRGVRRSVRGGVPRAFGPRAPECPKSVPGVSEKCRVTLRGHSRDTFWTLRSPGPEGLLGTPPRTLRRTPRFSGTLRQTLPGTLGPRRARETPVRGRRCLNEWWCILFSGPSTVAKGTQTGRPYHTLQRVCGIVL